MARSRMGTGSREIVCVEVAGRKVTAVAHKRLDVRGRRLLKDKLRRMCLDPDYVPRFPYEVDYIEA